MVSFYWSYTNAEKKQEAIVFQVARSFFDQIVVTRAWNALHGGVYVPVTEDTKPNLYLEDPLKDIIVNEYLTLTKVNPAFMTRQIADIAAERKGVQFHITSLNPIRPGNAPTKREEKALKDFEKGVPEAIEFVAGVPSDSFFYMAPLITEAACLKCHAKQGYKKGDIRGGISVTLPFLPKIPAMALILSHAAIGLAGLAGIGMFAVKLNSAYDRIRSQAVVDALTGIPNRRSFTETILKEMHRSQRDNYPLALILSDIDNFKLYNDTYGHMIGDECLRKIAKIIESTLNRPGDYCARYGGEEFVTVLPNTSLEGAIKVAENIRKNVEDLNIPHEKCPPNYHVSISLGVAVVNPKMKVAYEDLIKRADEALYRAKEKGRNRVEVF